MSNFQRFIKLNSSLGMAL